MRETHGVDFSRSSHRRSSLEIGTARDRIITKCKLSIPYRICIIWNKDSHMISKNKQEFKVSIECWRKTSPESWNGMISVIWMIANLHFNWLHENALNRQIQIKIQTLLSSLIFQHVSYMSHLLSICAIFLAHKLVAAERWWWIVTYFSHKNK